MKEVERTGMKYGRRWLLAWVIVALAGSCSEPEKPKDTLFEKVDPKVSNVAFENKLTFSNEFNIYTYRNFYNGGGVALGDINNDGLIDIYFTGNLEPNRLFLNKGNFVFEDITEKAGVAGTRSWSTGVSMADVNGDGWLDRSEERRVGKGWRLRWGE